MTNDIYINPNNLGNYDIPNDIPKKTCVDIGANVGGFINQGIGLFETIHYYEPYTETFKILESKFKEHENIKGWNCAVYSGDNETLKLISHQNKESGSIALSTDILNDHWDVELHEVTTVSLPTIIERIGGVVDYMKVDCETSEYYLFINQDLTNINYIAIELHWQMKRECYDELVNYILLTHNLVSGDTTWQHNNNKEVLFKNKKL